jgi:circadian clock protein KaiB
MISAAAGTGWALTLYVDGASPRSVTAIEAVRRVCDEELGCQVDLEVIDVQREPALALRDQVIVVPTLIKRLPGPPRRIVGDLSDPARLRLGLDLSPAEVSHPDPGV